MGRGRGEGKDGKEKAGEAPERMGLGVVGEGLRGSKQMVRQFSTNGHAVLAGSIQPTSPRWDGTGHW